MSHRMFKRTGALALLLALGLEAAALAQNTADSKPTKLKEVLVTAKKESQITDFKPDVEGTKIYSGKKVTTALLYNQPQIQNNNYRQAFSQLPGLLVSEQNNQGHVNINYRGVGDPHESQDLLTLKDGLPIGMERYGYSTTYYNPPLESVETVELVRGGSALLYGPQPGPVLNYVTYDPPRDTKFGGQTQHIFGTHDFYGTYNQVGGTVDRWGYLGYIHHSQSDGPRQNEDFNVFGGSLKLTLEADDENRWVFSADFHEKDSGEPGRLTLAQYLADRGQTLRPHDVLETDRYAGALSFERDLWESSLWSTTLYGSYTDRFSLRRTSNTSDQNNLDRREVFSGGFETRLRHDYEAFGSDHTLSAGAMVYGSDAPRTQDRSTEYPSRAGTPIFDFDYHTFSWAVFLENLFRFGKFSVAPAFRLEQINMEVKENFNTGKTSALHDIDETYTVALFGLGVEYALNDQNRLYANASQGFKPPQFDTLAPTGNNTLSATSLDEGHTWTYEVGLKGEPSSWLRYDASAFLTDYDNFFGTVTVGSQTQNQNVGNARYDGFDLSAEADLIGLIDAARPRDNKLADWLGSFSLYGNATFLHAEFTGGPLTGKEPAYAPDAMYKAGVIWRFLKNRAKIALLGTFVEEHFWADNNLPGSTGVTTVPNYDVWDLNCEAWVFKENMKFFFNIANLTDEQYFSRVRSDGIEPALGRQYYGGVKIAW